MPFYYLYLYTNYHTAYNNYNAIYLDEVWIFQLNGFPGLILNISVIAEILFFIFKKIVSKKLNQLTIDIFRYSGNSSMGYDSNIP